MAIDKARLHQLHLDSKALLESFADRLPEERLKSLRTHSFAGEWPLLVDDLCASLVKRQIPITPDEQAALAAVLAYFETPRKGYRYIYQPEETLAALNVVDPDAGPR